MGSCLLERLKHAVFELPMDAALQPLPEELTALREALALEVVRRIDQLLHIERPITSQAAEQCHAVRQFFSRPLVEALHAYLQEEGKSPGTAAVCVGVDFFGVEPSIGRGGRVRLPG